MEQPRVDIIIPVYRALDFLKHAVRFILGLTTWPYTLYLADDCSNMPELTTYYGTLPPAVHLLQTSRRRGFGEICNWAVNQQTNGEFICLLNSDIEPSSWWLTPMMERMLSDPKIGIVRARLLYPPNRHDVAFRVQHVGVGRLKGGIPYHPFYRAPATTPETLVSREVNAVTGACFLVRRTCWQELHGFDRSFTMGNYEDVDCCWRARKAGWKVWMEAKAVLWHWEHGSGENFTIIGQKNRALLLARWGDLESDEFLFPGGAFCSV